MQWHKKEKDARFFTSVTFFVISFILLIVISLLTSKQVHDAQQDVNRAKEELQIAQNDLNMKEALAREEVRKYVIAETGMDDRRVREDYQIAIEYFTPAFTWSSGESYDMARDGYVKDLGENHPFLENFMPPNNYIDQYNYVDLNNLNSQLKSLDAYAVNIENDIYTYIAIVGITSVAHLDNTGSLGDVTGQGNANVILTYSINGEGQVSDLGAWTTF